MKVMEAQEMIEKEILEVTDYRQFPVQGYYIGTCPNCGCNLHCSNNEFNNHIVQCCPTCDVQVCFNPVIVGDNID